MAELSAMLENEHVAPMASYHDLLTPQTKIFFVFCLVYWDILMQVAYIIKCPVLACVSRHTMLWDSIMGMLVLTDIDAIHRFLLISCIQDMPVFGHN